MFCTEQIYFLHSRYKSKNMAKNINISLSLQKIGDAVRAGHGSITTDKKGNKYVNVTLWVNDKEDDYGNDISLQLNSRTQGDAKVYVGNAKQPDWLKGQQAPVQQAATAKVEPADYDDDLPF